MEDMWDTAFIQKEKYAIEVKSQLLKVDHT
jgi:hypothetical protein